MSFIMKLMMMIKLNMMRLRFYRMHVCAIAATVSPCEAWVRPSQATACVADLTPTMHWMVLAASCWLLTYWSLQCLALCVGLGILRRSCCFRSRGMVPGCQPGARNVSSPLGGSATGSVTGPASIEGCKWARCHWQCNISLTQCTQYGDCKFRESAVAPPETPACAAAGGSNNSCSVTHRWHVLLAAGRLPSRRCRKSCRSSVTFFLRWWLHDTPLASNCIPTWTLQCSWPKPWGFGVTHTHWGTLVTHTLQHGASGANAGHTLLRGVCYRRHAGRRLTQPWVTSRAASSSCGVSLGADVFNTVKCTLIL